jgi:hypothetical protein
MLAQTMLQETGVLMHQGTINYLRRHLASDSVVIDGAAK